ncbi:SDR family oxidoreductase [Streptococcus sp. NLN64]|uniref:SDR family oxidoreductase n=1 Tax=Streptococcus sp. NLN64 TaxID=2822799 RepID=UPI0018C95C12|nr:SDR family oxidoreductase [Streptococcus sp. NLN64]MBG9367305.1 SDR family oxidoreductase [Streptococcus sp. NLN64]
MSQLYENKVALVTGGGSGIGRAIAESYAKEGAKVIIAGRRESVLNEVADANEGFSYVVADVTSSDDIAKIAAAIENAYNGQLDILVNGGWSNETTTMGSPERPAAFKHNVDHAIANGEVGSTIIVKLTYNNTSPQDSSDFGLATQLTQRYYQELVHDLIPGVESRYSSYAQSTSPEDLKASRRYRGFSGFSMGSVNTWRTFEKALEYFYFFNPMSGNVNTPAQTHANLVREKNQPLSSGLRQEQMTLLIKLFANKS